MIAGDLAELLRCSSCGSPYEVGADAVSCGKCAARFPIVEGIPVLLKETTSGTALEKIDYDAVHGITEQTIAAAGAQWKGIIDRLGLKPRRALEIGAGTGALTLGLVSQGVAERLIATDVSVKFLQTIAQRHAGNSGSLSLVACDANEPHFRADAFDLVVGRSILHHLLDYDATLKQCHTVLRPGGAAVFFEPVLEGKTIISLLAALVLRCDEAMNGRHLSQDERARIRQVIRHQTKSKWIGQDRKALSRLEDKYIFEIEKLKKVGKDIGFAEVEFLNNGEVNPTYWPYLVKTFKIIGIKPEKIAPYRWIGEEFGNTYGLMFPEKLATPMGFFVFRR